MSIHLKRTATVLAPDQSRVLLRPFNPGNAERAAAIISRIMALPEDQVVPLLEQISAEFSQRHEHIKSLFLERYAHVRDSIPASVQVCEPRRLLIGAYFLAEYSLESAALFNPSMVPHPDQNDITPGALRGILSLRATAEGHISSVTFRTGVIHADQRIDIAAPTGLITAPRQTS